MIFILIEFLFYNKFLFIIIIPKKEKKIEKRWVKESKERKIKKDIKRKKIK